MKYPISKPSSPSTTSAEKQVGGATSKFSLLHPDIIESHILTRLDGPSLATASCSSTTLHLLSTQEHLWSHVCHSTWPSTATPLVSQLVSAFPNGGPRAFFSSSFPLPVHTPSGASHSRRSSPPPELISAVDIRYRNTLIFTKVEQTETVTEWFRRSPFRIDLLEPKDVVPTPIEHPEGDDMCRPLEEDMSLSWILIDPMRGRAVNLSSHKPVSVQRHWLSGEVQVRYASILAANPKRGPTRGHAQCGIVVTCAKSKGGKMQVREVRMEMEDMEGIHLNGKDSLVILERALEGERGKSVNRGEEGKRRYEEYLEMKRERKERKLRTEGVLDVLGVAFGVSTFVAFWCFVWWT